MKTIQHRIESVMSKRVPKDKEGNPWTLRDKNETEYCYELLYWVPSGYSCLDLEKQIDALSASVGRIVELVDLLGNVIIRINKMDLPERIDFKPEHIQSKELILGYNVKMEPVKINPVNHHILLAGSSGYGKTDTLRYYMLQVIHHEPNAKLFVIDMKGCSFIPFEKWNLIEYADDIEGAYDFLNEANKERKRRSAVIRKTGNRDALKKLPPIYIIIDEFADLPPTSSMKKGHKDKEDNYIMGEKDFAMGCMSALSSLIRIGRELKIHVFLCTQYPTSELIGNQVKANMVNRVCLKLEEPIHSQVVLDNDSAYLLPTDKKGRAVVKNQGIVQVPYVGDDNAWIEILKPYAKEIEENEHQTNENYDNLI